MRLTEEEFESIKTYIEKHKPKNASHFFVNTAKVMGRSVATIHRIDASRDYTAYRKLIISEHTPKNKRVPLKVQVHNARIAELLAVRSMGRFGAYRRACDRLTELGA